MLNERNKKRKEDEFEISPLTMAIIPKYDDLGNPQSLVLERTGEYLVETKPIKIIEFACRFFGSSLEGRLEGTKEISFITHKAPIAIDPTTGMFFFPTSSLKNRDCSWINHSYVSRTEYIDEKKTGIIFENGQSIVVEHSLGSIENQINRTAQFRFLLERRMKGAKHEVSYVY